MIGMMPINGPSSNMVRFCQPHEAMKCRHGQFGLGCTEMHRVRWSARGARCPYDAQGWECPNLQLCTLEHLANVNTSQLPWAYTLVGKGEGWMTGEWEGLGEV